MANDDELNALIEIGTRVLGLQVQPEWQDSIRAHLATNLRLATLVSEFDLPDELDPAPVYRT